MSQISRYVRTAVQAQLANAATGFNARQNAIASAYAVDQISIDWTSTSVNFIYGRVNPLQFEESSVFNYPLLTIDVQRAQSTNRIKYSTFSGPVVVLLDMHHSWTQEAVLNDFSDWLDCSEDALVACLNDKNAQSWPGNLLWNGAINISRSPIQMGGLGWLQTLTLACQFDLTQ